MAKKQRLQKAIKKPDRMTRLCKRMWYTKATCECLQKIKAQAKKKKNRSLLSAAILGLRLKGCGDNNL